MKRILFCSLALWLFLFIPIILQAQYERRFVAEWEHMDGTLIRWPLGIPSSLVVELAKDDTLYVLVANASQKQQAINTFTSWNVNMNHCRFITAPTNSHWTRDWGPHYVFQENGICAIADPVFTGYPWVPGCFTSQGDNNEIDSERNGSFRYSLDNAVNGILADTFNCPLITLPIYMTGGNVMVDGRKTAVATQQMLDENFPGVTEQQFRQIAAESLGITNFIIVNNPEVNGIQHIDCYAKFLDEETILVKQVPTWHPEYACCEALATHLGNELNAYGDPYNIVRIFCGIYTGNRAAAYTNSLILNKKVLVPLFNISADQQALQVYEQAMPGYQVIGFPWGSWYYYDALHCRTMGVADRFMIHIDHIPIRGVVENQPVVHFQADIIPFSGQSLYADSVLLVYKRNSGNFETIVMNHVENHTYEALLPLSGSDSQISYYIYAADQSGRNTTYPVIGEAGARTFLVNFTITPGDANCDGQVNLLDMISVVNYIIGLNPEPFCFENAEVTGDGFVNLLDVIAIVNIILNME